SADVHRRPAQHRLADRRYGLREHRADARCPEPPWLRDRVDADVARIRHRCAKREPMRTKGAQYVIAAVAESDHAIDAAIVRRHNDVERAPHWRDLTLSECLEFHTPGEQQCSASPTPQRDE